MPTKLQTRVEQLKQASRIHGGVVNMCAAAVGVKLARMPIPSRRLRERLFRTIYGAKYTGLDEEEMEQPLAEFRSLNALFTRGVRPECRPLPTDANQILCPCDGTVQEVGWLERGTLLTAKGIEYTLTSLLPGVETGPFNDGAYGIYFLSPADCHRVFSPCDATIEEILHVPGRRLLVHPPFQRREFPVFALNERVIFRLNSSLGQIALVMVAGWGVGNITYPYPTGLKVRRRRVTRSRLAPVRTVSRGEWIATFELGSTVILLLEADMAAKSTVSEDEKVVYRQGIFELSPAQASGDGAALDWAPGDSPFA